MCKASKVIEISLDSRFKIQSAKSITQGTTSIAQGARSIAQGTKSIPHGYQSLAKQAGLSTVELALMLSLLVPMTIAMTYAGLFLHRSWQMAETTNMAVRYVSDIEPSSQISQTLIDEQISMRCQRLIQILQQSLPAYSCSRAAWPKPSPKQLDFKVLRSL
ncbi:MAG: hypothetical protein EBS62_10170 [Betaproteobacteria bacterium]|nr:hypothetical protein [Betaproteobacteria bacterium]